VTVFAAQRRDSSSASDPDSDSGVRQSLLKGIIQENRADEGNSASNSQGKMAGKAHKNLNVFQKPLGVFSKDPMTGFYRNGSCEVGPEDKGNHSIAATLTDEFLDFSASRGNNLRSIGLSAGCKWCLCAARWKEALDHAKSADSPDDQGFSHHAGSASSSVVPKVHLHATNARALDVVDLKDLKLYAAETEAANASSVAQSTHGGLGGAVKQRTELADRGEMTSREPKRDEHMS